MNYKFIKVKIGDTCVSLKEEAQWEIDETQYTFKSSNGTAYEVFAGSKENGCPGGCLYKQTVDDSVRDDTRRMSESMCVKLVNLIPQEIFIKMILHNDYTTLCMRKYRRI